MDTENNVLAPSAAQIENYPSPFLCGEVREQPQEKKKKMTVILSDPFFAYKNVTFNILEWCF